MILVCKHILSQHHKTTIIIVRMGSGVTWDKEEDEALSWAWVAASEDAITGTGQKASKFWSRVFEIYVELINNSVLDLVALKLS